MILCECGDFIGGAVFKDYIKTSLNPSTRSIGHRSCGLIFNFVDGKKPKRYSSRKELKILAAKFAQKNVPVKYTAQFLLDVDRLKSQGRLSDIEILQEGYERFQHRCTESLNMKR